MTVGELRAAIATLPDDMPVACTETHLTSGLAAAVFRYHFAARLGMKRYCDGLWIGWAGNHQRMTVHPDGRVVDESSGYKPELQSVLHDDGTDDPKWETMEERVRLDQSRGWG